MSISVIFMQMWFYSKLGVDLAFVCPATILFSRNQRTRFVIQYPYWQGLHLFSPYNVVMVAMVVT